MDCREVAPHCQPRSALNLLYLAKSLHIALHPKKVTQVTDWTGYLIRVLAIASRYTLCLSFLSRAVAPAEVAAPKEISPVDRPVW